MNEERKQIEGKKMTNKLPLYQALESIGVVAHFTSAERVRNLYAIHRNQKLMIGLHTAAEAWAFYNAAQSAA
jgi:hypothetical protein